MPEHESERVERSQRRDRTPEMAPEVRAVDREAALERLGGDLELLSEAIESFIQTAPEMLERIRAAIASGDSKSLSLFAHSMKGVAATLEAHKLVAEARRLEVLGREGDIAGARAALSGFERELEAAVWELREGLPA